MAWAKEKPVVVEKAVVPREGIWESNYPDSLDRWAKDLSDVGYKLDAEYDLENNKILYRFKSDAGLFQNVILKKTVVNK